MYKGKNYQDFLNSGWGKSVFVCVCVYVCVCVCVRGGGGLGHSVKIIKAWSVKIAIVHLSKTCLRLFTHHWVVISKVLVLTCSKIKSSRQFTEQASVSKDISMPWNTATWNTGKSVKKCRRLKNTNNIFFLEKPKHEQLNSNNLL